MKTTPLSLYELNYLVRKTALACYLTIGAGVWNTILAALGWYLHSIVPEAQLQSKIDEYSEYIKIVIIALFLIVVAFFTIKTIIKKQKKAV